MRKGLYINSRSDNGKMYVTITVLLLFYEGNESVKKREVGRSEKKGYI